MTGKAKAAVEQDKRLAEEMAAARVERGLKLTQADQEEINARRHGNDEAIRAAAKRKDALERSALPPQRRSTPQGRQEG